ncbi:hypothetical protein M409DRAFT_25775 [Zasmidium cellare ATCC 36951]|uniref:Uncharacterized protein n=1 Tax=Zasmidium cellare ATCC 36951 TaxID=1080233 RepID=A0A6A6CB32_ZASCE|nr:uncharacterized protein M409DRAFT_25775 [Zasmidium cellare ATCC 36951]KAF2164003.1 hypothetical protein M409DRAFT_25775 [Zasmidium cellare ATCC 36951]
MPAARISPSALNDRDPNTQLTRIADKPTLKATKEVPPKRSDANIEALKKVAESLRPEPFPESAATLPEVQDREEIRTSFSQPQPDSSALLARLDSFLEVQKHQQKQINTLIAAVSTLTSSIENIDSQVDYIEGGVDHTNRGITCSGLTLESIHHSVVGKNM